ncbi:MAG: hypothetical protein AB8H80_05555 [Planctomycetota bacterium]
MTKSSTSVSLFAAFTLAACGGGSSGGGGTAAVQSLQAPLQVSIVDASGGTASSVRLSPELRAVEGSDYMTDQTRYWIRDSSMEPLETVNSILDQLRQTRYWEQTNEGAYKALVSDESSGGGGERGNSAVEYATWTVTSTRASNDSPQIVSFWLEQEDTMGDPTPSLIYGRLTVSEESSDEQPLGQFTLYFKNLVATEPSTSTDTNFEGYLRTIERTDGQSEVEFFMSHGDVDGSVALNEYAIRDRVHVIGDPTTDSGRAYTESVFKGNEGTEFTEANEWQIEFNQDYLARRDVQNGNALAVLDRSDFTTRVYSYAVYDDTTEARIEQQGGFPVETADGDSGWAGFYGIWFPEGVELTAGQTLQRRSFVDNSTTPYTVFLAPGRLEKRTRSTVTFGDILDEELEYFDPVTGDDTRIAWDGTNMVKTATRDGSNWQAVDPPESISDNFVPGTWLSAWSQARGQIEIVWPASASNSSDAYVWSNEAVNANSAEMANGDLTLNGYFNMLRANITSNQANYQNSETPYLPDASSVSSGNTAYTFDKETLVLMIGTDPVTTATGVEVTQGPGVFGFHCGPLFPDALSSLSEASQATTTYRWMTGGNEWNQFRGLKDSDENFVSFDAPLRLTYTHSETGSAFDGRSFYLNWDGSNLGGIPHEEDTQENNYFPLFNIPSGTVITSGQSTYKIKQLEGEQRMVQVGDPTTVYNEQGFDLDGTPITAPSGDPYEDPAIGEKPEVTSAPLYVGGVSQSDEG